MSMTIHHIPVCPFCQRIEILLELKGLRDAVAFQVVDITKPRDPRLTALGHGSTELPLLEFGDGRTALRESRVILDFVDRTFPDPPVRPADPHTRALEDLIVALEGAYTGAGYSWVLNRDRDRTDDHRERMLKACRDISKRLEDYAPGDLWVLDDFGWTEAVFTPLMQRFWFNNYYEDFTIPDAPEYARFKRWHDACVAHPAAGQVTYDQIVTLYYDYAMGCGNGALPEGRRVSSFTFTPDWRDRPMPPRDKWTPVGDAELGLV